MRRPAPLHPGRRVSIVQRPDRKAHAATYTPGSDRWVGICGREVLAVGAAFVPQDEVVEHADTDPADLCLDCRWLLAFASHVTANVLAAYTADPAGTLRRLA